MEVHGTESDDGVAESLRVEEIKRQGQSDEALGRREMPQEKVEQT